jgi:cyanophycinase
MIVRGEPSIHIQKDTVQLAPGLGVLNNIIIDQHFTQRARLNRLITAVCYNPKNLGIGIDENTAIHIDKKGVLEVLGSGTVTIVDGSGISFNNMAEVQEDKPFSVFGVQMHVLGSSVRYDVYNRKPLEVVGDYLQI